MYLPLRRKGNRAFFLVRLSNSYIEKPPLKFLTHGSVLVRFSRGISFLRRTSRAFPFLRRRKKAPFLLSGRMRSWFRILQEEKKKVETRQIRAGLEEKASRGGEGRFPGENKVRWLALTEGGTRSLKRGRLRCRRGKRIHQEGADFSHWWKTSASKGNARRWRISRPSGERSNCAFAREGRGGTPAWGEGNTKKREAGFLSSEDPPCVRFSSSSGEKKECTCTL